MYLPRVDEDAAQAQAPAALLPGPCHETVLVIDDAAGTVHVAERLLRPMGYTVVATLGGQGAPGVAGRHPGPIEVVITDIVMPGPSGFEVAARLRSLRPDIAVVYSSGYSSDPALPQALQEPRTAYLAKPFTTETLGRAVRQALGGSAAQPAGDEALPPDRSGATSQAGATSSQIST